MTNSRLSQPMRNILGVPGKVLVVDDNLRNLQAIVNCLNLESFEVWGVSCAEEAIEILRHKSPELILLDVVMPGINGFELCRMIKDNPQWEAIPILFLSGDQQQESVNRGFELGGVDYIAKPFQRAELVARVRTHIELHRRRGQAQYHVERQANLLQNTIQGWQEPLDKIQVLAKHLAGQASGSTQEVSQQVLAETSKLVMQHQSFVKEFERLWDEANLNFGYKTFGIDDLIRMIGQWYVTAKRKNIELKVQNSARNYWLRGGSYCIGLIVEAILSNAVAQTPNHGSVQVIIKAVGGEVLIQVQNSGSGFPPDYLANQFAPYLKSPQEGARLGVGLASAKKAADRIGAILTLENLPQGGALVALSLKTDSRSQEMGES